MRRRRRSSCATAARWRRSRGGRHHGHGHLPYWIRDTEFIHEAKRTDKAGLFRGFPLATDQKTVARRSLWAAEQGFTVFTPDLVSTLHRIITSLLPHRLMIALSNLWRHLAG